MKPIMQLIQRLIRPRKKLSRARQWSRIVVWTAFAVVLFFRYVVMPPEPRGPFGRDRRGFDGRMRPRWAPTFVRPPVSDVPPDLWRIHIEITEKDVKKLQGYFWNGWRGARQERPEVLATVREGGRVYTNVAIHLKGAAGSFRPFDDKPALTMNFSKQAKGQQFHGYSKISLNNSVQDPSYLCEAISRELFEAAGVPVPRADHATVLINRRDLGLYVMTEGFGKPFLRRYFQDVRGNLYDGGFCQEITAPLDANSGDFPDDRSDLVRLTEAAMQTDSAKRWQQLSQVLDMDRFLSFLALEVMTCHWDGYGMNRNNYRLFHDLKAGRMVFIPHGMDQMFGVFRSSPASPIEPAMEGLVANAVMTTPPGRRLYLERIASLRTNLFLEAKLTNRVAELARRIRPTLAAYAPELAEQHDAQVMRLVHRISERARSLSIQLSEMKDPIQFDASGVARLADWAPQQYSRKKAGELHFARTGESGEALMHIAASNGGGTGAWRTRVLVEAGRYRFEGRVRTRGVPPPGGVSLGLGGQRSRTQIAPDDGWIPLKVEVQIYQSADEIEVACELRATAGEAWFDAESLRLVKQ
ncbi:MAG: CotH kinase family protein [Verrucomicrobia bacterium]|nr:CotH kinase family protein [Verrucomicrobiota bacterium]